MKCLEVLFLKKKLSDRLTKMWNKFISKMNILIGIITYLLIIILLGLFVYYFFICYNSVKAIICCLALGVITYLNMNT